MCLISRSMFRQESSWKLEQSQEKERVFIRLINKLHESPENTTMFIERWKIS